MRNPFTKNAHKKLIEELTDIEWAARIGIGISEFNSDMINGTANLYSFFL
jgi:hypothetical protein